MAEGMGGLSLSAGPSAADARSGGGPVGTGDFNFKPKGGLLQNALPLVALVAVLWLMQRK